MGLTLVLVRHGETDWTAHKRYCGSTDVPLNAAGREQAAALAGLAKEAFDSVWTSPSSRCKETAALAGLTAVSADALREFDFGSLEGKRWDDLDPATQAALIDFDGFEAPGGETVAAFGEREFPGCCQRFVDVIRIILPVGRYVQPATGNQPVGAKRDK